MNIQRFTAPTSREALAKARAVFGEGTLILSNRPVPNGVEVVATAEEALAELDLPTLPEAAAPAAPAKPAAAPVQARAAAQMPAPVSTPDQDSEQLAMSTLSFQDYVRERMLRRRHEAAQSAQQSLQAVTQAAAPVTAAVVAPVTAPAVAPVQAAPRAVAPQAAAPARIAPAALTVPPLTAAAVRAVGPAGPLLSDAQLDWPAIEVLPLPAVEAPVAEPVVQVAVQAANEPVAPAEPVAAPVAAPVSAVVAPVAAPVVAPEVIAAPVVAAPVVQAPVVAAAPAVNPQGIVNELQAMKAMIDERFNTLAWLGETRQDPIRANLMLKLIRAGYSPSLSRTLIEEMPEGAPGDCVRWLTHTLERNLRTDNAGQRLVEEGGIFALVGATGVGKTTTVAKLAGLCAREHGTASVGLVTLDTFRVGAHEQLRAHARQFGVVAHQAHDRAALSELLNLFSNRHMVLIDTTGVAPSDPRMRGMLDMLDMPGVNRLLVLNAGAHGDTLDHVLSSFKGTGTQHAILSKLDEAVKLGPALDTLIRHQFVLRGVTNGQRVPDDWDHADAAALVAQSMRAPSRSPFDPQASDLNFFFSPDSSNVRQGEALEA